MQSSPRSHGGRSSYSGQPQHPSSPASARIHAVEDLLIQCTSSNNNGNIANADTAALVGAVRGLLRRVAALEASRAALLERVSSLQTSCSAAETEAGFATEAIMHAEARVTAAETRASRAEARAITQSSTMAADEAQRIATTYSNDADAIELMRELERREAARLEASSRAESNRAIAASHARAFEEASIASSNASLRAVKAETLLEHALSEAASRKQVENTSTASMILLQSLVNAATGEAMTSSSSTTTATPRVGNAVVVLTDVAASSVSDILRNLASVSSNEAAALEIAAVDVHIEPSIRLAAARGASVKKSAVHAAKIALALITTGPEAVVVETSDMSEALAKSRGARLPLRSAAARRASRNGGWA